MNGRLPEPPRARREAVLVGGSAGALDALAAVLSLLPAGHPIPIVVVLHQPRRRESALVDVLQARCALEVREPQDKEELSPGVVAIAPPDYHLLLDAGPSFALSVDEPVHFSRPSIDVLFESAAEVLGAGCAAVVLSGANDDGARGARAVRDAGGLVVVQDPGEAQQPAMPRAALALCPDACILPAAGIGEWMRGLS